MRYWSLALHFISEPKNRSKLLLDTRSTPTSQTATLQLSSNVGSAALHPAHMLLTSRGDGGGQSFRAGKDGGGGDGGGQSFRAGKDGAGGAALTARTRAKETYNAYDENQVTCDV